MRHWFLKNMSITDAQMHKRASRVDVKKLEKQEAKLRVIPQSALLLPSSLILFQAKIEKRARRDLYEGSKLLDAHRKQVFSSSLMYRSLPLLMAIAASIRGNVYEGKCSPALGNENDMNLLSDQSLGSQRSSEE